MDFLKEFGRPDYFSPQRFHSETQAVPATSSDRDGTFLYRYQDGTRVYVIPTMRGFIFNAFVSWPKKRNGKRGETIYK
jgi:hypothetical protein